MERYEAYKDSGVEWIGEIPAGWDIRPSKWFIRISNGSDPSTPGDTPVYGSSGISFKTCGEFKLPPAVLLGRKGTIDSPSYIDHRYWNVDTAFNATSRENGLTLRYYFYLSTCFDYPKYQTNTAVPSMTQSDYRDMQLPIPDLIEQRAIVNFLDTKTVEIDELVADCEREVELLQEYRKVIISEAVTKGLDPHAPMKNSGIEWIGEIPEGWNCLPMRKVIGAIQTGPFGSQLHADDYTDNGDVCVVNPANIAKGEIDIESCNRIEGELALTLPQHLMRTGEIVFGRRGEMGRCALVKQDGLFCGTGSIKLSLTDSTIPSFAVYYLQCDFIRQDLELRCVGTTIQNLNTDILSSTPFVLPPLEKQYAIVEYLNSKTAQIDSLIDAKHQMAEKLREYRKSLISEAVTGKFKVPGVN